MKNKSNSFSELKLFNYSKNNAPIRVGVVYPGSQEESVASLGFQSLFNEIDKDSRFLPVRLFVKNSVLSNENDAKNCAAIFVTSSFEFETLELLSLSLFCKSLNIPSILGGITATMNPHFFSKHFDIVYQGALGPAFRKLLDFLYDESKRFGTLISIVTSNGGKIMEGETSPDFIPCSAFISGEGVFGDSFLVEVSHGCKRGCHYCLLSSLNKPCSFRSKNEILALIDSIKPTPHKIGLVSAALTDHPEHIEILQELKDRGFEVSTASLRMEQLTEELLILMKQNKQKTLTLAPETAELNLKKIIGKGYSEEHLFKAAFHAGELGFGTLKLYYMIGLPGEKMEDVEKIVNQVKVVRENLVRGAALSKINPKIEVSVNPFVPKPLTRFAKEPFDSIKNLKLKMTLLKKGLGPIGNCTFSAESPRYAALQWVLAHRLDLIEKVLLGAALNKRPIKELLEYEEIKSLF